MADKINLLERLREKNPGLRLYGIGEPEFASYGSVVKHDLSPLAQAERKLKLPSEGSVYEPSIPDSEKLPVYDTVKNELFGELDTQIGSCRGYNSYLNALEWHKSPEINIAATDLVLILAKLSDISDGRLDSSKVKAFLLESGDAVEIFADTLHFCPCQVCDGGFGCVVALPRGTNTNLEAKPSDPLLFRKNKWLFCHEDNSALIARGVVPAIFGENYRVNY